MVRRIVIVIIENPAVEAARSINIDLLLHACSFLQATIRFKNTDFLHDFMSYFYGA